MVHSNLSKTNWLGKKPVKQAPPLPYQTPPLSFTPELILSADRVVPVLPFVDPIVTGSVIFKGITAKVLVRHCFKVMIEISFWK
nr:putative alcohol dehydrogenase superfamily, zinc-type [Tanacetum cinerariifolium]